MKLLLCGFFGVLLITLSACSNLPELKAPCTDFGRYCPQTPINAWQSEAI